MIRIRRVDTADDEVVDELIWLHGECFGTSAPALREEDCYGHWWLAYDSDAPVAFAALVPAQGAPETGYLKRCGVLVSHRGLGLQRRLVRVREARARRLGWKRMVTDTTDNICSTNNLIRCGYRLFTPEVKWAWPESLYWEKQL